MDVLVKEGFDPNFGARPLRRAIQRMIEDPLSEEILSGHFRGGVTLLADVDPDGTDASPRFTFTPKTDEQTEVPA